ncbi:MAG: hypothetical protein EU542_04220 [Promethearchaeota archaeon]|nr:MAG: hypothetical protein EU542_04220 [Candidatus Lokiarchaeota archaeon]
MEDFLKQLNLSDDATQIYLKCLGKAPLSSFEIYSIVPKLSQEEYTETLNELLDLGLLVPIQTEDPNMIMTYLFIPPFNPIITYIANINANLDSIKNQLHQLIAKTLKTTVEKNKLLELDTVFQATQEIKKDIEEETIIQKQDVEDIVQGMENINIIGDALKDLHQRIKGVTQTEFSNLINMVTTIKDEIITQLGYLELKKHEDSVKKLIERVFKQNSEDLIENFTNQLYDLIEKEFSNTRESLNNITKSIFQFRDDFKMLLVNTVNNYEQKLNKIIDMIKTKNGALSKDLEQFEKLILDNFEVVIKNSVDSIAALNNPIDKVMKNYFHSYVSPEKIQLSDLWFINSISRVNENINNWIAKSNHEIKLILPKLETHLSIDSFKIVKSTTKIKIASSEAHTNSFVKSLKSMKSLEYRMLRNEDIIILKGDEEYLLIGILNSSSQDPLNDFIGFATDNSSYFSLLKNFIQSMWEKGSTELYQAPQSIGTKTEDIPSAKPLQTSPIKKIQPSIEVPDHIKASKKESSSSKRVVIKSPLQDKTPKSSPPKDIETNLDLSKTIQQQVDFVSKTQPKPGDEAGIIINNAFNELAQKLNKMNGEDFSKELQKIADIVLEKKGFSVTLHKLRSTINQYKMFVHPLSKENIEQIKQEFEEWKAKIL